MGRENLDPEDEAELQRGLRWGGPGLLTLCMIAGRMLGRKLEARQIEARQKAARERAEQQKSDHQRVELGKRPSDGS
jgi:hypothetical protein